jgi:hypothetical protein
MNRHLSRPWCSLLLVMFLALGACSSTTTTSGSSPKPAASATASAAAKAVDDTVRQSVAAENAKDGAKFVALWTDKGLKEFDSGTREVILSGKGSLGSNPVDIVSVKPKVDGDKATADVTATPQHNDMVTPFLHARFSLVKQDGKWILDGVNFDGSPPPAAGTPVVRITATEFAYALSKSDFRGNVAFKFTNAGKQQHELMMFKTPDGIDVATAKAALENIDMSDMTNMAGMLPSGFMGGHLSFTEPGQSANLTFAKPIPPGTYVFACFIPDGGYGDSGPVNPKGKPHIQLGMISRFTVK